MAACVFSQGGINALELALVSPSKSLQKSLPLNTPSSYEGFLCRVSSFTPLRWLSHSPSVSPLECARWGWECVETDLLRCVSCKAFLYARNDDILTNSASDAVVLSKLQRGHKPYCLWASTSSPRPFYTLHFSSRQDCHSKILARIKSYISLPSAALPTLDLSNVVSSSTSTILSSTVNGSKDDAAVLSRDDIAASSAALSLISGHASRTQGLENGIGFRAHRSRGLTCRILRLFRRLLDLIRLLTVCLYL